MFSLDDASEAAEDLPSPPRSQRQPPRAPTKRRAGGPPEAPRNGSEPIVVGGRRLVPARIYAPLDKYGQSSSTGIFDLDDARTGRRLRHVVAKGYRPRKRTPVVLNIWRRLTDSASDQAGLATVPLLDTATADRGKVVYALMPRALSTLEAELRPLGTRSEAKCKSVPLPRALWELPKDLVRAVSVLAERRLFHGDISPGNVFLLAPGAVQAARDELAGRGAGGMEEDADAVWVLGDWDKAYDLAALTDEDKRDYDESGNQTVPTSQQPEAWVDALSAVKVLGLVLDAAENCAGDVPPNFVWLYEQAVGRLAALARAHGAPRVMVEWATTRDYRGGRRWPS